MVDEEDVAAMAAGGAVVADEWKLYEEQLFQADESRSRWNGDDGDYTP